MATDVDDWAEEKARFRARMHDSECAENVAEHGPLAQEFADLAAIMSGSTPACVLDNVVWAARSVIPDADLVSITLRDPDGRFHTPVRTDPAAVELDRLQHETGEGPAWMWPTRPARRTSA